MIIPALDEEARIGATIDAARAAGAAEVIVADGGSRDGTPDLVRRRGVPVVEGPRGRGPQMHAGALAAAGDVLWFLHADTHPPGDAADRIREAYPARTYERLATIKRRYDPDNLFRYNRNIPPSSSEGANGARSANPAT